MTGRTLSHYRVGEELSRGGMGVGVSRDRYAAPS
jgi:hypothetical protein